MNLQHLRYIIEVEKTKSISKAAENLFMAQPNLSKAIKELEETIGITIFKRTSKGAVLTNKGTEFIAFAKNIISQVDAVEKLYQNNINDKQSLSISVPRASYIADAFIQFTKTLDIDYAISINYKETNAMKAINNITDNNFNMGIIRYQEKFEKYFHILFKEKELNYKDICKFNYVVLISENHELAKHEVIDITDLSKYIEITYGDPYIPMLPKIDIEKSEFYKEINKRLYTYERGSQFDLLSEVHTTFMRSSPISNNLLEKYKLVQKECEGFNNIYKDVLIYNINHKFSDIEKSLLEKIEQAAIKLNLSQ